jgi:hypothetical protein
VILQLLAGASKRLPAAHLRITFPAPGEVRVALGDHLLGGGNTVRQALDSVDPDILTALVAAMLADHAGSANDDTDDTDDTDPDGGAALAVDDDCARAPTDDELATDPEWLDFCDGRAPTDADVEGLWAQMHPAGDARAA